MDLCPLWADKSGNPEKAVHCQAQHINESQTSSEMPKPSHREQRATMFCKLKKGGLSFQKIPGGGEVGSREAPSLRFRVCLPCSTQRSTFMPCVLGRNQRRRAGGLSLTQDRKGRVNEDYSQRIILGATPFCSWWHFLPPLGPGFYLHRGVSWFLAFGVLPKCLGMSKAQSKAEKANSVCAVLSPDSLRKCSLLHL